MPKKQKQISCGMADHTVNPKCKRRMAIYKDLNEVLDNEYDSTKLLIPTDVLDQFKEMYHRFSVNNPNPNENIQRFETKTMNEHFNNLKNISVTFDYNFYNDIVKVVGQKDFVVKGYLTWSLNHQFDDPVTVQMFPRRGNLSVPPMKIWGFQLINLTTIEPLGIDVYWRKSYKNFSIFLFVYDLIIYFLH